MRPISEISIDDEVADSFSYISESRVVIGFTGYFDLAAGYYQDKPCSLIIEQWASAYVEVDDVIKTRKQPLEQGLGIISMVFALTLASDLLEAHVLTLDNRYLLLKFTDTFFRKLAVQKSPLAHCQRAFYKSYFSLETKRRLLRA